MGTPDFEGILTADEKLLWQGRPVAGAAVVPDNGHKDGKDKLLLGLIGAAIVILILIVVPRLQGSLIGYPVLLGGVTLFGWAFWYFLRRKPEKDKEKLARTWYALSNRRMLVAQSGARGMKIYKYVIGRNDTVAWDEKTPGTVILTPPYDPVEGTQAFLNPQSRFDFIENGQQVVSLILDIQKQLREARK